MLAMWRLCQSMTSILMGRMRPTAAVRNLRMHGRGLHLLHRAIIQGPLIQKCWLAGSAAAKACPLTAHTPDRKSKRRRSTSRPAALLSTRPANLSGTPLWGPTFYGLACSTAHALVASVISHDGGARKQAQF